MNPDDFDDTPTDAPKRKPRRTDAELVEYRRAQLAAAERRTAERAVKAANTRHDMVWRNFPVADRVRVIDMLAGIANPDARALAAKLRGEG